MTTETPNRHQYLKQLDEKAKRMKALSDHALTELTGRLGNIRKQTGGILSEIGKKQDLLAADEICGNPALRGEFEHTRVTLNQLSGLLTDFCRRYDEIQKNATTPDIRWPLIDLIRGENRADRQETESDRQHDAGDDPLKKLKELEVTLRCILDNLSEEGAALCKSTP